MASRKSQQNSAASVLDGYEPLEVIGSGTFGLIRKVKRISDGKIFARKELQFDRMTDRDRKQIVAEVNILRGLQHENIVKYEERFIDRENQILYIVMEYCEGGDLGSTIKKCRKTNTLLPEEMVWSYVSQMVLGLDACHYRGSQAPNTNGSVSPTPEDLTIPASAVLHRDLKPENVFLDGNQNIKIGDFGLSKEVAAQSFACTYVGTPYYMSPELATGSPYDIKADIWALGCVAFELCALAPPFDAQDQAELTRKIKLGHVPELPRGYSNDLGNLIRSMLELNPKRRPTTRHLLREHHIRLACRTIELATMSRKIAMEKTKLKAQYYELEMRERALSAKETEIASLQASTSKEREHEERLIMLEQRERQLEARELAVLEREVRLDHQIKKSGGEEDSTRERFSSNHHRHHRSTTTTTTNNNNNNNSNSNSSSSSIGIRKPIPRRVSSGTVTRIRASPNKVGLGTVDGLVEVVHIRPAVISPRSYKADAIRQRFGKVVIGAGITPALGTGRTTTTTATTERLSRRRPSSEGSEEWVDNEGETEGEATSLNSSRGESREPSIHSRRTSASAIARQESTEDIDGRYTSRSRSSRKSITNLPPSARAWVNEIVKGNIDLEDGEDISMRDASAFFGSDDKENQQQSHHALELASDKCGQTTLPTMGISDDIRPNRPALATRTTIATEPAQGATCAFEAATLPAIYDLSNDEDLPSPFLRKVTRQNNEVLAKRGIKNGSGVASGLVGPSNFLARAAAVGAARQSMAAAAKDSAAAAGKAVAPPTRRLSAVSAAPTARVSAMPTSASANDIRSIALNGHSSSSTMTTTTMPKRRNSALPGSIGLAHKGSNSAISARKSYVTPPPPPVSTVRQRAA